jgi:CheY-like chemotaxis protein
VVVGNARASVGKARTSILIVDTDPATRALVESAVDPSRVTIAVVGNVREGWESAKSTLPGLIVVDADIPKGWNLCTELKRKSKRLRQIPLILLSAKADDDIFHNHQSLPSRADAYLSKPLDELRFKTTVDLLLEYASGTDEDEGDSDEEDFELEFEIDMDDLLEEDAGAAPIAVAPEPTPAPSALDAAARGEIDRLRKHVAELELELADQRRSEGDRLREQAREGFQRLQALRDELEAARRDAEELRKAEDVKPDDGVLAELRTRNDALTAELAGLRAAGQGLEETSTAAARQVETLRRQIEALEAEREALADQARHGADAAGDLEAARAEARAAEAARAQLAGEQNALRERAAAAEGAAEQARAEAAKSAEEAAEARALAQAKAEEAAEARALAEAKAEEASAAQAAAGGQGEALAEMTAARDAALARAAASDEALEKATSALKTAEAAQAALADELVSVRERAGEANAGREAMAAHAEDLAAKLEDAEERAGELMAGRDAAVERAELAGAAAAEAASRAAELQVALAGRAQDAEDVRQQLADAEARLAALQAYATQLEALHQEAEKQRGAEQSQAAEVDAALRDALAAAVARAEAAEATAHTSTEAARTALGGVRKLAKALSSLAAEATKLGELEPDEAPVTKVAPAPEVPAPATYAPAQPMPQAPKLSVIVGAAPLVAGKTAASTKRLPNAKGRATTDADDDEPTGRGDASPPPPMVGLDGEPLEDEPEVGSQTVVFEMPPTSFDQIEAEILSPPPPPLPPGPPPLGDGDPQPSGRAGGKRKKVLPPDEQVADVDDWETLEVPD